MLEDNDGIDCDAKSIAAAGNGNNFIIYKPNGCKKQQRAAVLFATVAPLLRWEKNFRRSHSRNRAIMSEREAEIVETTKTLTSVHERLRAIVYRLECGGDESDDESSHARASKRIQIDDDDDDAVVHIP
jgi:hypothetical protein